MEKKLTTNHQFRHNALLIDVLRALLFSLLICMILKQLSCYRKISNPVDIVKNGILYEDITQKNMSELLPGYKWEIISQCKDTTYIQAISINMDDTMTFSFIVNTSDQSFILNQIIIDNNIVQDEENIRLFIGALNFLLKTK